MGLTLFYSARKHAKSRYLKSQAITRHITLRTEQKNHTGERSNVPPVAVSIRSDCVQPVPGLEPWQEPGAGSGASFSRAYPSTV